MLAPIIGIISDSHNNETYLKKAAAVFARAQVRTVIHCGDLCNPLLMRYFLDFKFYIAAGNCDSCADLVKFAQANELYAAQELELTLATKKLYVSHGHQDWIIEEMIEAQIYDFVLHGHTHKMRDEKIGKTRIINPGALAKANNFTVALLDISGDSVQFIDLD